MNGQVLPESDQKKLVEEALGPYVTSNGTSNLRNPSDILSADGVSKIRKALELAHYSVELSSLRKSWECLVNHYRITDGIDISEDQVSDPILVFMRYTEMGYYPPPEALLAVITVFQVYLKAEGNLLLEEAFFGKEEKWLGNFSAIKAKSGFYFKFHLYYAHQERSLEVLAEEFLNLERSKKNPRANLDVDSFLRGFRRWKLQNP